MTDPHEELKRAVARGKPIDWSVIAPPRTVLQKYSPTPCGPGKFKYRVDAWVYSLSLNGCDDEIHADEYGSDWYGMFKGIVVEGSFCDLTSVDVDEFKLQPNDIAFLQLHADGCILSEDDQGFVDVRWFTDAKERDDMWAKIRADLEESAREREAS